MISLRRGMASKALLMSIVVRSVRCGGIAELKPSVVRCVRFVSKVLVECNARKPCCDWSRGMWGVILLRIRRSVILDVVQSSVMGLYDDGCVGSLFGLSMVMIVPCFQMLGMLQCAYV